LAYKADIAGGSLKVYESRIIAELLLTRLPPAEWRRAIEVDNVLQKTSIGTAKRQASLIKARLKQMTPELWELVRDGTKPVATQAVYRNNPAPVHRHRQFRRMLNAPCGAPSKRACCGSNAIR